MLTALKHYWERVRNSYWLVPSLMLLTVIALSYGLLALDGQLDLSKIRRLQWLSFSTSEGARAVLSTIAASTFSAATLTFSVTMVTLSLTSSQFGPRLLRNFLRDPLNQFTFGAFIGTFIYCLLIMRGLVINGDRIPNISISVAIVMVLLDAALFIAFIHHLTSSIRVEYITHSIGKEFITDIYKFLPTALSDGSPKKTKDDDITQDPSSFIQTLKSGYVQAINYKALETLAEQENITLKLLFRPGHFVLPGGPLVEVWPVVHLKSHIEEPIRASFYIGNQPTAEQDLEFTIRQLVQIAARALSPGINDPFTAMVCIDYLAAGLAVLAGQDLPDHKVRNEEGRLLLIKYEISFRSVCDACFIVIRQMCNDNPPVVIYLLETLAQLAVIVKRDEDRKAVLQTAKLAHASAIEKSQMDDDHADITERYDNVKTLIEKYQQDVQK